MSKQGFHEMATIILASLALLVSGLTSYFQFFYKQTNLSIAGVSLNYDSDQGKDTVNLEADILFLNTGDTPIALVNYSSYYTLNDSVPESCYTMRQGQTVLAMISLDNPAWLTSHCNTNPELIIQPGTIQYYTLQLGFDLKTMESFLQANGLRDNPINILDFGAKMTFVDSKGQWKNYNATLTRTLITSKTEADTWVLESLGEVKQSTSEKSHIIFD